MDHVITHENHSHSRKSHLQHGYHSSSNRFISGNCWWDHRQSNRRYRFGVGRYVEATFVNYRNIRPDGENPFFTFPAGDDSCDFSTFCGFFLSVTTGLADGAEEGVEEGNVPPTPLVDTFPAVADDDTASLPAEGAFETVMEDVSLVEEATSSSAQQSQTINNSNGSAATAKHPLKRLWKKATKKFTPADHPAVATSATPDAEQTAQVSRAPTQSQQPEDEMQLTLAEETDEL